MVVICYCHSIIMVIYIDFIRNYNYEKYVPSSLQLLFIVIIVVEMINTKSLQLKKYIIS